MVASLSFSVTSNSSMLQNFRDIIIFPCYSLFHEFVKEQDCWLLNECSNLYLIDLSIFAKYSCTFNLFIMLDFVPFDPLAMQCSAEGANRNGNQCTLALKCPAYHFSWLPLYVQYIFYSLKLLHYQNIVDSALMCHEN